MNFALLKKYIQFVINESNDSIRIRTRDDVWLDNNRDHSYNVCWASPISDMNKALGNNENILNGIIPNDWFVYIINNDSSEKQNRNHYVNVERLTLLSKKDLELLEIKDLFQTYISFLGLSRKKLNRLKQLAPKFENLFNITPNISTSKVFRGLKNLDDLIVEKLTNGKLEPGYYNYTPLPRDISWARNSEFVFKWILREKQTQTWNALLISSMDEGIWLEALDPNLWGIPKGELMCLEPPRRCKMILYKKLSDVKHLIENRINKQILRESLFRKTFTKITPEDQRSPDDIKRNAKPNTWRDNREDAFDDDIDEMIKQPEFKDIDSFVNYKLDNEEYEFSTQELQALAHNTEKKRLGYKVSSVSSGATSSLRSILVNDYGFKFVPRVPVKFSRGGMASSHGTNPYAGMGGGSSGAGSEMSKHVGGFHGMGGGPGAMGGGYDWDKNDKRNLPMGAAKKK